MKKKIFSIASITFLLLVLVNSVSAASLDVLDVDTKVDKESYNYEEEILSTINVKNESETNKADNIRVQVDVPEEIQIIESDDLTVDGQSVLWEFDQIDVLENEEVSFKTILPEPEEAEGTPSDDEEEEEEDIIGKGGPADEEEDDGVTVVPTDDESDTSGTETVVSSSDETKPQTGDESSIVPYVVVLVLSIALVGFVVLGIRKKKAATIGATSLALLIAIPLLAVTTTTANAYEATQEQSISKTYNVEIEGEEYEYVVTVTADVTDEITEIAADPDAITLYPGEGEAFSVTGTTTSGNTVDLVEDENLSFNISEPDKL